MPLQPVVDLARYASLAAGLRLTSTVERLRGPAEASTLDRQSAETLELLYDSAAPREASDMRGPERKRLDDRSEAMRVIREPEIGRHI